MRRHTLAAALVGLCLAVVPAAALGAEGQPAPVPGPELAPAPALPPGATTSEDGPTAPPAPPGGEASPDQPDPTDPEGVARGAARPAGGRAQPLSRRDAASRRRSGENRHRERCRSAAAWRGISTWSSRAWSAGGRHRRGP
jgi:hypothetical protein